jgi:hypothetical protein
MKGIIKKMIKLLKSCGMFVVVFILWGMFVGVLYIIHGPKPANPKGC